MGGNDLLIQARADRNKAAFEGGRGNIKWLIWFNGLEDCYEVFLLHVSGYGTFSETFQTLHDRKPNKQEMWDFIHFKNGWNSR